MKKSCVFFGINNSKFSLSFLKELNSYFNEVYVVTSKNNALSKKKTIEKIFYIFKYHTVFEILDLIIARGLKRTLKDYCRNKKISYENFHSVNDENSYAYLKNINPQIIFVCSFSELITNKIIAIPKYGIYNFHFGDLPLNQGPNPIQWTLINKKSLAIVTCHELNEKFDKGNVVVKAKINIGQNKSYKKIESLFIETSIDCFKNFMDLYTSKSLLTNSQENNKMKYFPKVNAYQKYKLLIRPFLKL
tara:strand:+ start:1789 stop:2529 length:741 start_codon:yes stop_codon:yes gene_type:complete